MAKTRRSAGRNGGDDDKSPTKVTYSAADRELVVIAAPDAGLRGGDEGVSSVTGTDIEPLAALLSDAATRRAPVRSERRPSKPGRG